MKTTFKVFVLAAALAVVPACEDDSGNTGGDDTSVVDTSAGDGTDEGDGTEADATTTAEDATTTAEDGTTTTEDTTAEDATTTEDATAEDATTTTEDATAEDAVEDTVATTCETLESDLTTEREVLADGCERGTQCGNRYNPLCPNGGCFTSYQLGNTFDAIEGVQDSYQKASCGGGAVCDCLPPPEAMACVDGACTTCPESCPYTCDMDCTCYQDSCGCDQPLCLDGTQETCQALSARMSDVAADIATCTQDSDCAVGTSPLCPQFGCYLVFNRYAAKAEVNALVKAYQESSCLGPVCACTPPPESAACVDGVCQGVF